MGAQVRFLLLFNRKKYICYSAIICEQLWKDWPIKNAWDHILRSMCQPLQYFELMSNDAANTNLAESVIYSTRTMNTARERTLCHYYSHLGMDTIWFPGSGKIRHLGFILKTEILFFRPSFPQITLVLIQHLQQYHSIESGGRKYLILR